MAQAQTKQILASNVAAVTGKFAAVMTGAQLADKQAAQGFHPHEVKTRDEIEAVFKAAAPSYDERKFDRAVAREESDIKFRNEAHTLPYKKIAEGVRDRDLFSVEISDIYSDGPEAAIDDKTLKSVLIAILRKADDNEKRVEALIAHHMKQEAELVALRAKLAAVDAAAARTAAWPASRVYDSAGS